MKNFKLKFSITRKIIFGYLLTKILFIVFVGITAYFQFNSMFAQNKDILNSSIYSVGTVSLILIIINTALFNMLIRIYIVKPLDNIKKYLNLIASGELTTEIHSKYLNKKDEFGEISNALKDMHNSLKEMILNISEKSKEVSANSEELAATSEEMSASSQELTSTMQQVADGATSQAKDLTDIASAMKDVTSSIE
ncbi:MAG: methyl-accepting chemotaxis protein, partial [Petroclostridium sp.]|nr:methyl-accepting chemotaxis protein [Clostridia bacterium]MDK2811508.1 methyl-accepting chemotaxis protein [Petroclostridium sp.]